jgi:hypothetical protein
LASIEASGTLIDTWPESRASRDISSEISSLEKVPNRHSIWYLVVLDNLRDAITGDGNVALEEGITWSHQVNLTFGIASISREDQIEGEKWGGLSWTDENLLLAIVQDLGLDLGDVVPPSTGLWREKIEGLNGIDDPFLVDPLSSCDPNVDIHEVRILCLMKRTSRC